MLLRTYEPVAGSSCVYDWRFPRQPMVLNSHKPLVLTRPVTNTPRTPVDDRGWRAPALGMHGGPVPLWHPSTILARQPNTAHRVRPLHPSTFAFRCLGTVWSIRGMVFSTPVDAVGLAARIRDELPPGSSQNYATMLILNYLVSYSERYGLHVEEQNLSAVTSLFLEFLYLAWYHGVDIKLDQAHTKDWSVQTWKDSASLGINLKATVAMVDQRRGIGHDQLRDARTLLSFGAIVSRYHEALKMQTSGLERFRKSYCPLPAGSTPLLMTSPSINAANPADGADKSSWGLSSLWGSNKPQTLKRVPPSPKAESLPKSGLNHPPPMDLLAFPGINSTTMAKPDSSSCHSTQSVSMSLTDSMRSATTTTSFQSTQIAATERLEAYLSVLGMPDCGDIKMMTVKTKRLVSLEEMERTSRDFKLEEPLRRTRKEFGGLQTIIPKKEPLVSKMKEPLKTRWMTGQELKVQRDKQEEQRGKEKPKELKKMKWKGIKSTQVIPRRAALVNSHLIRSLAEGSPEAQVSPVSKPDVLIVVDK